MQSKEPFFISIDQIPAKPANLPLRFGSIAVYVLSLLVNIFIERLLGHRTTDVISDEYHVYYTPPTFMFSIWALIYASFTVVVIYSIWKNIWSVKSYILLNLVNILNGLWVYVWSYGTNTAIAICLFILLGFSISLFLLWRSVYNQSQTDWKYFATRNTIAFYLGWIIAATLINLGAVLVYCLGASQQAVTIMFWILCPCLAIGASLFNTYLQGKHGFQSCFCLWFSVLWAMGGALSSTLKYWN